MEDGERVPRYRDGDKVPPKVSHYYDRWINNTAKRGHTPEEVAILKRKKKDDKVGGTT